MKLTVYKDEPKEEEVKLKLESFGKGVRVVVVNDKGEYSPGMTLLEIYPQGIRRMKNLRHSAFDRDGLSRIRDITNSF